LLSSSLPTPQHTHDTRHDTTRHDTTRHDTRDSRTRSRALQV
jgi:hypothetical protein